MPGRSAEEHFADEPVALEVYRAVADLLADVADLTERTTTTQVAFARSRAFAWLWCPVHHLGRRTGVPVVLSVALGRRDLSPRWKQVVHPSARQWMHHLEVHGVADLDDEVADWLAEAADRAGARRPSCGADLRRPRAGTRSSARPGRAPRPRRSAGPGSP